MQVTRLERELAGTKSREDNLREEVADAARREATALKKQSTALEEVGQRRCYHIIIVDVARSRGGGGYLALLALTRPVR